VEYTEWWKKIENPLRFDKVMVVSLVTYNMLTVKKTWLFSGPDHGPSGSRGMKATMGPLYIYLQY